MQPETAKELKALQKENVRLKKMVAEQALDSYSSIVPYKFWRHDCLHQANNVLSIRP